MRKGRLDLGLLVDQATDKSGERLMFGSDLTSSEEVPSLDFGRRSAGRNIGLMQDKDAAVAVATQEPSVAVFAVVNLALFRNIAVLRRLNRRQAIFVPRAAPIGALCNKPCTCPDSGSVCSWPSWTVELR